MQVHSYSQSCLLIEEHRGSTLASSIFQTLDVPESQVSDDMKVAIQTEFSDQFENHADEVVSMAQTGHFERLYDLLLKLFLNYKKRARFISDEPVVKKVNKKLSKIYDQIKQLIGGLKKEEQESLLVAAEGVIDEEGQSIALLPSDIKEMKRKLRYLVTSIGLTAIGSACVSVLANSAIRELILNAIGKTR